MTNNKWAIENCEHSSSTRYEQRHKQLQKRHHKRLGTKSKSRPLSVFKILIAGTWYNATATKRLCALCDIFIALCVCIYVDYYRRTHTHVEQLHSHTLKVSWQYVADCAFCSLLLLLPLSSSFVVLSTQWISFYSFRFDFFVLIAHSLSYSLSTAPTLT